MDTLAPASRHTRAAADSSGQPKQSRGLAHRQEWEDRGRGKTEAPQKEYTENVGIERTDRHCGEKKCRKGASLGAEQRTQVLRDPRQHRVRVHRMSGWRANTMFTESALLA